MKPRPPVVFERLDRLEWALCQRLAGFSMHRPWLATLRLASRLGDWPLWVALIAAMPWLRPDDGWTLAGQYSLTALVAVGAYRVIKTSLRRERPFITFTGIVCQEPARDHYSFPSGHTLHAVMFCTLSAAHTPWLLPMLLPAAMLIAVSRVGLGLHYLSDVAADAVLGLGFAVASLYLAG